MKKVLSLLLALTMLFSVCVYAEDAQTISGTAFPDVAEDHANIEAIETLAEMGIINGYPDGTFGTEGLITRAEFVKMLMVLNGSQNVNVGNVTTGFPDVDGNGETSAHWAISYIKTAIDLGIINGYPDGTFNPDGKVKYEEAIKMTVCYTGRDQAAKDRAKTIGMPLWPDAYLSFGTELLMNKNVSCKTGDYATRANVAQIVYNTKDVPKIAPTPVVVPGGGSFSGYSEPEKKISLEEALENRQNWSGKRSGEVVAAGWIDENEEVVKYILETNIYTREGLITSINHYQMIVKMDKAIDGCEYVLFEDEARTKSFSHLLAHDVSVSFKYDGDDDKFYVKAVESLQESKTIGSVSSEDIEYGKTAKYNENATTNYGIVYFDKIKEQDYTVELPLALNGLKVIYNDVLVDTLEYPLSINDFIPKSGSISYVKEGRSDYKLIRIKSYETYVVGKTITSEPRGIEDKYKKQIDGITPLRLQLDDRVESGKSIIVKKPTGEAMTVSSIKAGNVLVATSSKCGTRVGVTVYTTQLGNKKISGISEEGLVFSDNISQTYPYSDYYKTYVQPISELEQGDRITAYVNSKNEIVYITESQASYTIGYLKEAILDETQTPSVLTLKILTAGDTPKLSTYSVSRSTKIRTATMSEGEYVLSPSAKYNDMADFYNALVSQATAINSGKASGYNVNAAASQPIRFVVEGNVIEELETMALDTDNRFSGTPLMYTGTQFKGIGEDMRQYAASSGATYIFVPNDRKSWAESIYKMGNKAQCSSKLVEYGKYNIEPFFLPNASGVLERKVFVVYNENIDAQPNYKSETIVVKSIDPVLNSAGEAIYNIVPQSGLGASKSAYKTEYLSTADNAYLLDASFAKIPDGQGEWVRRAVKKGDVIRVGYAPGGAVRTIEIVFDISDALSARKYAAYNYKGDDIALADAEDSQPTYYGRVGLVTNIPQAPEYCTLSVGVDTLSNLSMEGTSAYANQNVCLNTYTTKETAQGPMEVSSFENTTLDYINEGDMIYVWQAYSAGLKIKAIYAVRYEDRNLLEEYAAETTPTSGQ